MIHQNEARAVGELVSVREGIGEFGLPHIGNGKHSDDRSKNKPGSQGLFPSGPRQRHNTVVGAFLCLDLHKNLIYFSEIGSHAAMSVSQSLPAEA